MPPSLAYSAIQGILNVTTTAISVPDLGASVTGIAFSPYVSIANGEYVFIEDASGNCGTFQLSSVSGQTATLTLKETGIGTVIAKDASVYHQNIPGSIINYGTSANRPTAIGSANLYLCTDLPTMYFDDPVSIAWKKFATEYMDSDLLASSYTVVGNLALQQYAGTIRACSTSIAVGSQCALTSQSFTDGTAYSVKLVANFTGNFDKASPGVGVCISNGIISGTSDAYGVTWQLSGTSGKSQFHEFLVGGVNTAGNPTGTYDNTTDFDQIVDTTGKIHLRLLADGTLLHAQVSNDGFNWVTSGAITQPTGITNYGFFLGDINNSTSNYTEAFIYQNSLGTPLQYSVTGATNANPSVITIGTHSIQAGDLVSINGMVGNTGPNSVAGTDTFNGGRLVSAVTATTISVAIAGNHTWTSGGVVTLISR